MKTYKLLRTQFLPIELKEAWEFFSSPKNLARITPSKMNFSIISMSGGEKMFAGQIITYKITVLPFVRLRWVTEIREVKEHVYFSDVQQIGPYAQWNHRHGFKTVNGGVEMTDDVEYALPLGFLGQFAHALFVRQEINRVFEYRFKVLKELFPQTN